MNPRTSQRIIPFASVVGIVCVLVLFLTSMRTAPKVTSSCDCPTVRLDDAYCRSELVFEGTPVSVDTVHVQGGMENAYDNVIDHVAVRFQVERMLKGPATMIVDLASAVGSDACGFSFILGHKYLVFAAAESNMLTADRCSPTRSFDTVTRDFADSLAYVMRGHQYAGRTPLDIPCR